LWVNVKVRDPAATVAATEMLEEGNPGGVLGSGRDEIGVSVVWTGVMAGRNLKESANEGERGLWVDAVLAGADVLG
jgi:hypothetical protein